MSDNVPGAGSRPSAQSRRRAVVEAYSEEERRLARYARSAYVVNRSAFESARKGIQVQWQVPPRYDGVTKTSLDPQDAGKSAKNVWFEMARWCLRWKVQPVPFIQYVFSRIDIRDRIPEPLQVCNDGYVAGFHEFVTKGAVEVVATAFETQTREAESAFLAYHEAFEAERPNGAKGKKWVITQNVILARSLPLSPLFRYLLALASAHDADREGDEDAKYRFLSLARGLFDRAVLQFWAYKDAYTEHWDRWLPKTFLADAEARFRKLAFNEASDEADTVG